MAMKVRTVMPGSRNAAISDCTDWGALKKVLLWGSSNIGRAAQGARIESKAGPASAGRSTFYTSFRGDGLP